MPPAGRVGGGRGGMTDGRLLINPTLQQLAESDLDLVVAGTEDAISMVEAGAHQVAEETVLQALRLGHEEIRRLCQWQQEIKQAAGKPLMSYPSVAVHPDIVAAVRDFVAERI